ncbi:hydrogenase maturation nickel metallochaperone HypA [Azospirillum halopraeferens]|uniref:hydrogenase maturation nickel metallochaperone HypA n=1 Tax=Azospirillum halopraeferens TaxID=34010 RepID=UPI0003F6F946|nr:hydrogenase maturation nickel metallochaperone HypA [Azospirillum halopraeferens]
MHELSLCRSIVDLVVGAAAEEGVRRILSVTVEIGDAAAVDPDALLFCFPVVAEDTAAAGAALVITRVPVTALCHGCGAEFTPGNRTSPCPACGGYARTLLDGRQMRVVSFEAE